eukprot:TRINITY_DN612_c0_g1_i8.p1 TRINITY_DN612_c0_g1~~TRINITY_DN612_c0_g1_i8.p1  ORF type:complete len:625 (-),score=97.09 TRINITY_DN612_c0_g1_i8:776-2650(-)
MGTFPSALRPSGDENEGHDNRSDDGSEGSEDLGDLPTWTEDFNLAQEWQHVLRALQVDSHPPTSHTNEAPPKDLLFRQLRKRELFGVPKRQLRWESTIPPNDRKVYADVKSRIDDVITYCDGPNRTPETVIEAMRKINEHLSAAESKHAEYCKLLLVDLGFQRYLQFLLINPDAKNLPFEVRMYAVKDGERNMIRKFALECLRQLTLKDTTLLSALASNNQELILCLFHLLESHHHIEVASSLLQDILAVLPTIIDASTIPNLVTLINKANPKDFASLFRVVPFLIYELDDPISMDTIKRFPPSSMASKKAKFSQKAHMIERNQAFLISRSLIVERLIEVLNLIASKSIPRIPRRLLRIFQGQSNDLSEVLSEIPQASLESIIQGYMNMNQHIDCLFVLSNLLAGKRAADVQIKCVKLQIIPKLQKILPKLNWDPEPHDTSHGPTQLHGPGCDCNPESALNTQFLRVVHSLCDRDLTHGLTRRLMFTREELRRMDVKPDSDHDRCGSSGLFGLLPGVVNILKRQNQDSPYRFWLSSCVEAFLRGSPPKYQDSLNSNGLMNHAIESVLKNGGLGGEGLQTGYDLISELVKFNPRAMCAFSESFNEKEFERFIGNPLILRQCGNFK